MNSERLHRRGFDLGPIPTKPDTGSTVQLDEAWALGRAFKLGSVIDPFASDFENALLESKKLYHAVAKKQSLDDLLALEPYRSRITSRFEALGSAFNEGSRQEIETVFFDGLDGEKLVAEDLWVKASWLSFYDDDQSLRFRFSFGVDFEEDVASDEVRQYYSAQLAELIFEESRMVTENSHLEAEIKKVLNSVSINFVERIVYFNAPNGGAYLHHDRERGHAGVVYAQLTGETYWLALPRHELVRELIQFVGDCYSNSRTWPTSLDVKMQSELLSLVSSKTDLEYELETFSNSVIIHLINETEEFVQILIERGFGLRMTAGDVVLLPQSSEDLCCWHSVFSIGEVGQALSFAIRPS